MTGTWKQTLVFAAIMGLVAAGVVWMLERDQINRLHLEVTEYLNKHDAFRQWEGGQAPGPS